MEKKLILDAFEGRLERITERKKAEEALLGERRTLQNDLRNAPVLIDVFDEDSRCILLNKESERT